MAIVVHMRASISKKRPYGARQARIFLDRVLPVAPDIPIQIAHLAGTGPGYDDPPADSAMAVLAEAVEKRDPRTRRLWFDVTTVVDREISPAHAGPGGAAHTTGRCRTGTLWIRRRRGGESPAGRDGLRFAGCHSPHRSSEPLRVTRRRTCVEGSLLTTLFLAALGCAARTPSVGVGPACVVGDSALVRETLYFGRNRPGGGTVDDAEWRTFLNQVLTPRFPAGLTVVNATGQWKGQSGVVEQEQSNVVTVYHAEDAESNRAVREVALEYKRRFGQEAVLRERIPTCAAFE
jgi:hypothetical protein